MSVNLERFIRTAPEAHDRTFEEAHRGIEVDGPLRRQVGRRGDGQLVRIIAATHDLQVAACGPVFADGHPGDFAHRQAMQHGDRQRPDARFVFHVQHGAVDVVPVGVGTVEHDDAAARFGTSVHHTEHRDIVGIEPQTHVLHVDHQYVERPHGSVRRALRIPVVERADRDPGRGIHRTCDMLARVGRTAKPVLGGENAGHVEAPTVQQVDQVYRPVGRRPRQPNRSVRRNSRRTGAEPRDGRMVGQHRHAPPFQLREISRRVGHTDQYLRRGRSAKEDNGQQGDDKFLHTAKITIYNARASCPPDIAPPRQGILRQPALPPPGSGCSGTQEPAARQKWAGQ